MRNQCLRLLLLRCHVQSQPHISQVNHLRFTSSLPRARAPHASLEPIVPYRHFSTSPELAVEPAKPPLDQASLLVDVFANNEKSNDEIKLALDSNNVVISHDLILSVLKNPNTSPDVAKRVFDWVLEGHGEKLSSQSYNWMLGILGSNGFVKESWDMIEVMKKKGYGVAKGAFARISEKFDKEGLNDDVERLKELYASGTSTTNPIEEASSRISQMIRRELWGDELEKRLQGLGVEFSSDLITMVLRDLEMEPNKALIFFRWVEESGLFEHDQKSFNAMAIVLSREECSEKFWRIVNGMKSEGHEMEKNTYVKVLDSFVKRKMINDAVDLYEFAMMGGNKPTPQDCTFLLKKIVVSKELDMNLFMKVLKTFKANGNLLTDGHLDAIFKSLTSVGRITEINTIVEAMEEGGYLPSGSLQSKIAFKLSSGGKTAETLEFIDKMVASRRSLDHKTWASLVKGHCAARNLDEASDSLREMVENVGASSAQYALDLLVGKYCLKNRPLDAYKFISEMVSDKDLTPWNTTYRTLTSKLLGKRYFKEALDIMNMMKNHGFPPDLDSFAEYFSKKGSAEDALLFSRAMTSKRYPATSVFIRLFEAYLKSGRHSEAQDFLSKCPRYIKNHAAVLDLFCNTKSRDITAATSVTV